MPTIRDCTVNEVLSALEVWQPFVQPADVDIFIASVGFEDRASACFEKWCAARNGVGGIALLISYPFNEDDNAVQLTKFLEFARLAGVEIVEIQYQRMSIYGEVVAFLKSKANAVKIMLDLSGVASFVFYPIMCAITEVAKDCFLSAAYCEALSYFPKKSEWDAFKQKVEGLDLVEKAQLFDEYHFQSHGVENVFESAMFPGQNLDNTPTTLIVIPNFSVERVGRMIDFAAERYSLNREEECEWIIGIPPDNETNGWRAEAMIELFNKPNRQHAACTREYKEILFELHKIWTSQNESRSLIIATVGSKAQHLGTFLFLKMHPEVGLILSEPKEFIASKYSSGIGKMWQVSLGVVQDLTSKLEGWNRIEFAWG